MGIKSPDLLKFSPYIKLPKGRMQKINLKNNSKIIIDYSHTPDALKKVLKEIKNQVNKNIYTILGCGGDRDEEKRPFMGKIAEKYSNKVILTDDNPRKENPKKIINDIIKGFTTSFKNYGVIHDRKQAIKKGVSFLKKGDILLIAGRGDEQYQIYSNKKIKFNDYKIVQELINK